VKTAGAIKNGKSIDTGKIGYKEQRHTKQKNTTQKTIKMSKTDPTKNPGMILGGRLR